MFSQLFNRAFYGSRLLLLSADTSDKATTMIGDIGFNVEGLAQSALDVLKGREGILATQTIGRLWTKANGMGPAVIEELSRRGDKTAENVIQRKIEDSSMDTLEMLETLIGASRGFKNIGRRNIHEYMEAILHDVHRRDGLEAIKRLKNGEERLHEILDVVIADFPDLRKVAESAKEGPVRFKPLLRQRTGTGTPEPTEQ